MLVSGVPFLATASRPASTVWTVIVPWLLMVATATAFLAVSRIHRAGGSRWAVGASVAIALCALSARWIEPRLVVALLGLLAVFAVVVDSARIVLDPTRRSGSTTWVSGACGLITLIGIGTAFVGLRVTEHWFIEFAEQMREGPVRTTDHIRIGPWTYDSVCVTSSSVYLWNSGDTFIVASAIRITDGNATRVALREGSEAFACDQRRTR